MKAKNTLIAGIFIAACIATGLTYWNAAKQRSVVIAASVPGIPETSIKSDELRTRIQNSSAQAKNGPEQIKGLQELSRLYDANGLSNEAWQCYAALVALEPKEAKWAYRFARILAGYGQLEEATPLFERAVELDPLYTPSHIRLADTLLKQNRLDEARSSYEDAMKNDPENPYALVGLARVDIALEDWAGARAKLEKAVASSSFQIGADLLADVYAELGLDSKENIVLQNTTWGSYADIPDPWSLALIDDCYDAYQVSIAGGWVVHQGDTRTGLRYIRRAVELDPESSMLHYQLAGVLLNSGETAEAQTHFKRCTELQPDYSDAWLALVNIAKDRNSPTALRRAIDAALDACPDSPSLNIEKAKFLLSQNKFDQSIPYFERSIELRPYEAVGYIELGTAYLTANRAEEGIKQMLEALRLEPNNPIALTTMVFDSIMRDSKSDADYWFEKTKDQPRISERELSKLGSLYKNKFSDSPPL